MLAPTEKSLPKYEGGVRVGHCDGYPSTCCLACRTRQLTDVKALICRDLRVSRLMNAPTFGLLSAGRHPFLSWLVSDVANPLCLR